MQRLALLCLCLGAACQGESNTGSPDFLEACVDYTVHLSECAESEPLPADVIDEICTGEKASEDSHPAGCTDLAATLYDCIATSACEDLLEGVCEEENKRYDDTCLDDAGDM